jgi:uncharacterized membrane protein
VAERKEPLVVGVMAAPGLPRELAEELEQELPDELGERFPDVSWEVALDDEPLVTPATLRELKEVAQRRRREKSWDFAICLTDLPLRSGHRPVTLHASTQHRVGVISVPALGPVGLEGRVRDAAVTVIEGMLGEGRRRSRRRDGSRHARMVLRLHELSSPLGSKRVREEGTIRFVAGVVRGNLRLILGMVRANDPSLVIVRLSRAMAAALGTAALSLASVTVWLIADGMGWLRLLAISVGTVTATCAALIIAHDLWDEDVRPDEREQVVMFNLATLLTVLVGVVSLYLGLFAVTLGVGAALLPPSVVAHQIGHDVAFTEYVHLAWLVASLATIGGALGSVVESDLAVRDAMYRYHPDARAEVRDA